MTGAISWDWLRVFAACARHGNFTRAARDLGLTPSTVSAQMAALEGQVCRPLFVRHARGVTLTPAGERLLPAMRGVEEQLVQALRELASTDLRTIRVTSIGDVGLHWLMPRLPALEAALPGLRIELHTSTALADAPREGFDLCVRHGYGVWPGLTAERLAPWRVAPLVRADLKDTALASLRWHGIDRNFWHLWADIAGLSRLVDGADLTLWDTQALVAQATLSGMGAGLLSLFAMTDALSAGNLVQKGDGVVLNHPSAHYLATPQGLDRDPSVRAVMDWLLAEANRPHGMMEAHA